MEALFYGLITAAAMMAGGFWISSRPSKWLTEERLALLMAPGAGVLLGVLLFEFLPVAMEKAHEEAFAFVFLGMATILLFDQYVAPRLEALFDTHDHDHEHHDLGHGHVHGHSHAVCDDHGVSLLSHGAACSAIGCLLVCTFFDGIAMVAGFAVSLKVGLLLSLGIFVHLLPEGTVAASLIMAAGRSAKAARQITLALGAAFLLGMAAAGILGGALGYLYLVLPFTAGILLYVVFVELLPIAQRTAKGVPILLLVTLGFGVLERILPHSH